METRLLEEFQALIKYGTIANASRVLSIDPSVLGKDLKKLEAIYRVKLFKEHSRGPHRLELTVAGQLLNKDIEQLLYLTARLKQNMDATRNGYSIMLPITVSPALAQELLHSYIFPFIREKAPLRYELMESSIFEQERLIIQGKAELGYANSPITNIHMFKIIKKIPTSYYAICRKDNSFFATTGPLPLEALEGVPLCLAISSAPRIINLMEHNNLNTNIICTNVHRRNAVLAVREGLGVTVFPLAKPYEDSELTSVLINYPSLTSHNVLYTLRDKQLSEVSKGFVDFMLQKL